MARRTTLVRCRGVRHWYDASLRGVRWCNEVLPAVSLELGARRFEAVIGEGAGPVTLLHCIAGLTIPREGRMEWCDLAGRSTARPRITFIPAGWRPYRCFTVRDVLEQAVPPGTDQRTADTLVARTMERCALSGHAWNRARRLAGPLRPLLAIGAALVAGAEWVLLDMTMDERRSRASDDIVARRTGATVVRRLAQDGLTILAAGPPGCYAPWIPRRVHRLPAGELREQCAATHMARVAEGPPVATVSAPT